MIFSAEHEQLRETVQRFVRDEINPYVDDWEKAGIFPAKELYKKAADLGLLGINKPEEYGGLGLDYSFQAIFAEEIGRADHMSSPLGLGVHTTMATPALTNFGGHDLKQEFLAPAIAGERVACIGVSEPSAGSDVAQLKTQAKQQGDDYVINGTKMWITNSTQSDFICLLANTSEGPVHKNKSLIIVPSDTPGISFSKPLEKLGMHASDTAQIFFDNVKVPVRHRIGEEGKGFFYQMQQFQEERLWCALSCLKVFENCIDRTIEYTRERQIFGAPVLHNQSIHYHLAELQAEVELLRSLCFDAVEKIMHGEDVTRLATIAKFKLGKLTQKIPNDCLQYWGGMGFMWDNYVARVYRDIRAAAIGGGSDETMLAVLSKIMGTHP
ncbi:MAG: acyl-CoA dehydrogenase family protein [Cellvibrionaceae bacterium]|nr:acyl-CoA dehydrogenase family protein [Cellvibrionaceae bacterium]